MTTLNGWDDAPSPAGDPTLHAHKLGLHDVPEDDCPACRVDRGAALLDERRPGWWEDVDLDRLEMQSECRCVIGQTFRDYIDGLADLGLTWVGDAPWQNGFDLRWRFNGQCEESYATLTELWRNKINQRRAR